MNLSLNSTPSITNSSGKIPDSVEDAETFVGTKKRHLARGKCNVYRNDAFGNRQTVGFLSCRANRVNHDLPTSGSVNVTFFKNRLYMNSTQSIDHFKLADAGTGPLGTIVYPTRGESLAGVSTGLFLNFAHIVKLSPNSDPLLTNISFEKVMV